MNTVDPIRRRLSIMVTRGSRQPHHWHVTAPNHEITAQGENYTHRDDMLHELSILFHLSEVMVNDLIEFGHITIP